jgi:8-hydroxy-5-deazaflavin:NADPH oxidoreductase
MDIGIIGAGQIGATLAHKFSIAGHTVRLANSRGPESIKSVAQEAGATAVSVAAALKGAEVVIVSIPEKSVPSLPKGLFSLLPDNVVVIDTGNYYPGVRDDLIPEIESGLPESQWVSAQLGRSVVKAFNSIMAYSLAHKGMAAGQPGRIAIAVSGDDPTAKKIAIQLVDAAGFDAVDAGGLCDSWRHQPGTAAYCTDLDMDALRKALLSADRNKAPQFRDAVIKKMGTLKPGFNNEDLVNINRSYHT